MVFKLREKLRDELAVKKDRGSITYRSIRGLNLQTTAVLFELKIDTRFLDAIAITRS